MSTRGFVAHIIRSEHHSPADGLSAHATRVLIPHPDGDTHTSSLPTVRLVIRDVRAVTLHHFEPADPCPPDQVGYMAGGAYVEVRGYVAHLLGLHSAAYPLQDRSETPTDYAALGQ